MNDIVNFTSTSSGPNGWSALSDFLNCPAKAKLKRDAQIQRAGAPWPPYAEEGKPVATMVGSIYGELVQRWLREEPVPTRVDFQWNGQSITDSHHLTCAEAKRLYDARVLQPHYKVIGTEVAIKIPDSIFGIEITGNIDVVCEGRTGPRVGDIKTEGRMDAFLKAKFSLRQQKWLYALGYEILTGEKVEDCFIDLCVKTADPKFRIFDYEGLTPKRFTWLRNSVEKVKIAMADPKINPSISNCIAYTRPCDYLGFDGMCSIGES